MGIHSGTLTGSLQEGAKGDKWQQLPLCSTAKYRPFFFKETTKLRFSKDI